MCYQLRHQATPGPAREEGASPGIDRLRPRWIGAAAATLVGGLALAAFVAPSPSSAPTLDTRDNAATTPVAARSAQSPGEAGTMQRSAPVDDGVPTGGEMQKAGIGHCHEL